MKIGILYVEGALPAFENFGHLPTHKVNKNGTVNGQPAHKVLDGLIIPGGSIMESQSITSGLIKEIHKMDGQGSFIIGMCSGFQLLSLKTDIGRKSPCPVERDGLGILGVTFHPLIGTDRVEAEVADDSFMTQNMVGKTITGFHCHTYGDIRGDSNPLFYSMVKRTNYTDNPRKILSGVRNDDGNVIGTMIHGSLDENPSLIDNIFNFLDVDEEGIQKIYKDNQELKKSIKREIGIEFNLFSDYKPKNSQKTPPYILMASNGSDSGKTFLTTGIVGALRKRGYKIGVLKIGPDIRDIVPSLYLNKEKMEPFSSIQIGELGWMDLEQVISKVSHRNYDLVIVEGVMSIFTGLLNPKTPFSTAEIAYSADIPTIIVSACNKGGIESAALDLAGHVEMMKKIGINTKGIILNKVYDHEISKHAQSFLKKRTNIDQVWEVPKVKLTERGNIPEVEIKLEEFCLNATTTVEKYIDPLEILNLAKIPDFKEKMPFSTILRKFVSN
jgi:cobyric acid synthase